MTRTRLPAATHALLGLLLAVVLAPLLAATPASAARTITISLTANGPKPASATASIGDTVVFKNDDATFVHQVANKSTNWQFNSGPLAPGQAYTAGKLGKTGKYEYQGVNLDSFSGYVLVPSSPPASAAPAPSPKASPAPARSTAPSRAPSAASPSPTGGTGAAGAPPLAGGFGTVGVPTPPGLPRGPAPNVAPTLPGEDPVAAATSTAQAVAVGRGRLPQPPTGRRYGLPAALAAVAAAGVASLLVRLLLAHPAARRAKHARGDLSVTVD